MEHLGCWITIRQARYLHGLPDEERIARLKEQMEKGDYIRISPEVEAAAKKFRLPRYALQKGGEISYIHDMQPRDKNSLYLMKRDWLKMLDILTNEKPVYCSRELLVAMKQEARAEALGAETEKDAEAFYSIDGKLSCFLEEIEIHNLLHILKGQAKEWVLPEFISPDERKKLSSLYRFPEKEVMMVADRKTCYPKAIPYTPFDRHIERVV